MVCWQTQIGGGAVLQLKIFRVESNTIMYIPKEQFLTYMTLALVHAGIPEKKNHCSNGDIKPTTHNQVYTNKNRQSSPDERESTKNGVKRMESESRSVELARRYLTINLSARESGLLIVFVCELRKRIIKTDRVLVLTRDMCENGARPEKIDTMLMNMCLGLILICCAPTSNNTIERGVGTLGDPADVEARKNKRRGMGQGSRKSYMEYIGCCCCCCCCCCI
jgi:hypothetical protein